MDPTHDTAVIITAAPSDVLEKMYPAIRFKPIW